ncbi:Protein arginine N-methyltransferase 2 [Vulpes lagopus]
MGVFSKPKYNHILKPEDCLSEPCTILQLDTRTVQIADLETMSGELHFEIRKAGALHGFTAWFSVRFQSPEEDEPQLVLSTGPFHPILMLLAAPVSRALRSASELDPAARQRCLPGTSAGLCATTHWKQVLFMMDEPMSMLSGDVVTGSVVLQRNPVWRRHMSVALSWSVTSTQDPTSQKGSCRRAGGRWCWETGVAVAVPRPRPHAPALLSHPPRGQLVLLLVEQETGAGRWERRSFPSGDDGRSCGK